MRVCHAIWLVVWSNFLTLCIDGFISSYNSKFPRDLIAFPITRYTFRSKRIELIRSTTIKLQLQTDLSADDFLEILTDLKSNTNSVLLSNTVKLDARLSKSYVDGILGTIYNKTFEIERRKQDPEQW